MPTNSSPLMSTMKPPPPLPLPARRISASETRGISPVSTPPVARTKKRSCDVREVEDDEDDGATKSPLHNSSEHIADAGRLTMM
jgi:hypothetical protein